MSRRKLARFGISAMALGAGLAMACGGKSHEDSSAGGEPRGGTAGANGGVAGARGGSAGTLSVGGSAGSVGMGGTVGGGGNTAGDGGRLIPQTLCNAFFGPSPCVEGDSCTCRDDPRPECQATMTCAGGWQLTLGACNEPPEETPCPESPEAARDMPCRPGGKLCEYPSELSCVCRQPYDVDGWFCRARGVGPEGPVPFLWYCGEQRAGCPEGIPAVGSACENEGVRCGNPCGDSPYARVCRGGLWEEARPERECL